MYSCFITHLRCLQLPWINYLGRQSPNPPYLSSCREKALNRYINLKKDINIEMYLSPVAGAWLVAHEELGTAGLPGSLARPPPCLSLSPGCSGCRLSPSCHRVPHPALAGGSEVMPLCIKGTFYMSHVPS